MSIMIPFLYIIFGYILGKYWEKGRMISSFILMNILIPTVVFLTLFSYKDTVIHIILLSFSFSSLMYFFANFVYRKNENKKLLSICFSYFNIGWLGLPIAISFFGQEVTPIIIAAYIGGLLFGSSICIHALNTLQTNKQVSPLKKVLKAPPFIAFVMALLAKSIFSPLIMENLFLDFYLLSKLLMSIFGMAILGMWLQKSPLKKEDFRKYFSFSILRIISAYLILSLLLFSAYYFNIISSQDMKYLFIIPIFPVAANIVVLETYYLNTAKSAAIISVNTIIALVFILTLSIFLN